MVTDENSPRCSDGHGSSHGSTIVHTSPGRLRLRMPWFKNKPELAQGAVTWISALQGIKACQANADCASITICYEESRWSAKQLHRRLKNLSPVQFNNVLTRGSKAGNGTVDSSSWFELTLSSAGVALGLLFEPIAPLLLPFLLAGSALPMLKRAYEAMAKEERLTVDVLDASATALLSIQGQFAMATFMVWLVNLGDFIRDATVAQARSAVESVLAYQETWAWVVKGHRKIRVRVPAIKVRDTVVVYPGDRIPVDGVVLSGTATVDQQALTGESLPVEKQVGADVFASTVVANGKLYVRTVRVGDDTEAAKIVRLVEEAPVHETTIQNYAERWANDLVPYSFVGAGVRGALGAGASGAASVLVIDYGTGIRIAAPTAVLSTMTKAVRQGILFKGGRALEQLAGVDAIVFDKTGTLTTGVPDVVDIQAYGQATRERVLALAAAAEQRLNHPVAQCLVRAAKEAKVRIPARSSSEYSIGLGVSSQVNGSRVHVGCPRYMQKLGIEVPPMAQDDIDRFGRQTASPICVALNDTLIGVMAYADKIRPEADAVVRELKSLGIKTVMMLTGDHKDVAKTVATRLGIDRYEAEVLPGQKVAAVKALQQQGYKVAFIGDGINDSPALAHADIGIAMKGGADVAQETAHVVLLSGDLDGVPAALRLAREAVDLIHENWNIIAVPNTIALALACCGLLGPGAATLLSNGSAIVATGNALRPLWNGSHKCGAPVNAEDLNETHGTGNNGTHGNGAQSATLRGVARGIKPC